MVARMGYDPHAQIFQLCHISACSSIKPAQSGKKLAWLEDLGTYDSFEGGA